MGNKLSNIKVSLNSAMDKYNKNNNHNNNNENDNLFEIPENINPKSIKTYIPNISKARVIKCYDGDTITIAAKLPNINEIYKFSLRIKGIDCPEIKTSDENERYVAVLAKEKLYNLVFNKIVVLKNISLEKYGRLLADVYIDDQSCAKVLLDNRLAVNYEGGTKCPPKNWKLYYELGTL